MNSTMKKYSLRYMIEWLLSRKVSKKFSDSLYVKLMYYSRTGKRLNISNPSSFNEKLQWMKLYDHNPLYTRIVNKVTVKEYVADKIGREYVVPTLGVWERFEDIEFKKLPQQFVLKCNHDSGGLVICRNLSEFDFLNAKDKITRSLHRNYYWTGREWPYKNVVPCVMAEQYLIDESQNELKDYKFFCFNGTPRFFKVDFDRFIDHHANYYDLDMNLLEFGEIICPPVKEKVIKKPDNFEKMVDLAKVLSEGFPFLRVDFYNIKGKIYFGELTLFPASGAGPFVPASADIEIGKYLSLN